MLSVFALASTNLNIRGTSAITSNFSVRITDITTKEIKGNAYNSIAPTFTNTSASFKVHLVNPGDSMTYEVTVLNDGNIDAKLENLNITDSQNPGIDYKIQGLNQHDILTKGRSITFTVTVNYNNTGNNSNSNTSDLKVTLDYTQNS